MNEDLLTHMTVDGECWYLDPETGVWCDENGFAILPDELAAEQLKEEQGK